MRAIRVVSAALLGVGALTSFAPSAGAAGHGGISSFGFSVLPSSIEAGGQVTLRVDRDDGGCEGPARVSSQIFEKVTIPPVRSSARVVVDWDAKPGASYQVVFTCDGASGITRLTIADGPPHPHPRPAHHVHPKGVHAGEGGSFAGLDLKEIGLGAALIAGSVGTAYHLSRRRTDEDAT